MKITMHLQKVITLGLFSFLLLFAKAEVSNKLIKVFPVGERRIAVSIDNPGKESMSLSLENNSGTVSYYEERFYGEENISKLFDLSRLKDGVYQIRTKSYNSETSKVIMINDNQVEITEDEDSQNAVDFSLVDHFLFVKSVQPGLKEVKVDFVNKTGVFFEDHKTIEGPFTKRYNLEQLNSGFYRVRVLIEDDFYEFNFKMD